MTLLALVVFVVGSPIVAASANKSGFDTLLIDIRNLEVSGSKPLSFGLPAAIHSQGALMVTSKETDFAIQGDGFFSVYCQTENRILLTRRGDFHFNDMGLLCDSQEDLVLSSESHPQEKKFAYLDRKSLIEKTVKYHNTKRTTNINGADNIFLIQEPETDEGVISEDGIYFRSDIIGSIVPKTVLQGVLEASTFSFDDAFTIAADLLNKDTSQEYKAKLPKVVFSMTLVVSHFSEKQIYSKQDLDSFQQSIDSLYGKFFEKLRAETKSTAP